MRFFKTLFVVCLLLLVTVTPVAAQTANPCAKAKRTVFAEIAAINQLIKLNRLGASIPMGMMFVLMSDLNSDGTLRADKRPRPIVLRVNQGDCLVINFTNLLGTTAKHGQTPTRNASIHINGMQLQTIGDDGSWVGANASSLTTTTTTTPPVPPGQSRTYRLFATEEGTHLLYSMAAAWSGAYQNDGGQQTDGLFGALHVEPPDAEWYRSQVTQAELAAATEKSGKIQFDKFLMYTSSDGDTKRTLTHTDLTAVITGPRRNNYQFDRKANWCNDPNGKPCQGTPQTNPNFQLNYAEPNRTHPYREFTIIYHELFDVVQAFPNFYDTSIGSQTNWNTLNSIQDQFAINYGTGGIGAEILANRLGVGPMGGCPDCKYEEFFLDSWTVGDPSMIVDVPANTWTDPSTPPLPPCTPSELLTIQTAIVPGGPVVPLCSMTVGTKQPILGAAPGEYVMLPNRKATKAFYPDDPSNVYHSYLNDHVKFRVLHGGTGFSHVHHQHAHQWLRTPNNNESTYLDSQLINPGSAYTLEITFGGSGNRNNTPGDSIFHCHFYPHFAGGMWALWRVHDMFEPGTTLDGNGVPMPDKDGYVRALPDAEILAGTPTPAIVPLPTRPMAPKPARTKLVQVSEPGNPSRILGTRVEVHPEDVKKRINPGYPFFIPGISGVRAPHPPMDFAVDDGAELNGGLPRHLFITATIENEQHTRYNFSKDLGTINAFRLPEEGTEVEKIAMDFHKKCTHASKTPEGVPGRFETNGRPPAPGAPYADPALKPFNPNFPPPGDARCQGVDMEKNFKHYRAAVFQTDLVFNKQGWHFPQSRMLALWEDVTKTISGERPPEPLFFRTDSDDAVEYWHTNLVPDYYLLDDFQVRTPTDIIGQHIHLVKFDVMASDGASNGWNYEDGTLSPDDVRARIDGIAKCGGLLLADSANLLPCNQGTRERLIAQPPPADICNNTPDKPCDPNWLGAQTTVQRWMADPLKSPAEAQPGVKEIDRTLRTVFTHDHFGPSTHQQTGLYAAFLIEPLDTEWFTNEDGTRMYTREDGGPTSWQAVVQPKDLKKANDRNTYREFAIALQDFQLTYAPTSRSKPAVPFNCNPTAPTNPTTNCEWADTPNVLNQTNLGAPYEMTNMSQQGVSAGPTQGTYTFNYRNEPLPYRLQLPASGSPADPRATDPSYVFSSQIAQRVNPTANPQPKGDSTISPTSGFKFPKNPLSYDMRDGDPYTPLLRTYENDNVQIRTIVGAHMLPHPFTIQGVKWLFEPGDVVVKDQNANSGYKSTQAMGISEHFEFLFTVPKSTPQQVGFTDFLYMPDSSNPPNTVPANNNGGGRGIVDGMWGLMRAYQSFQSKESGKPLMPLPTNKPPANTGDQYPTDPKPWWWTDKNCGSGKTKTFTVYANNATIDYNPRENMKFATSLVYSLTPYSKTNSGSTTQDEPLILRANAGDCIEVTLVNNFDPGNAAFAGKTNFSGYAGMSAFNNVAGSQGNAPLPQFTFPPSKRVGLNPALLSYDVATSSGTNIGWNSTEATVDAVASGTLKSRTYYWYAGHIENTGKGVPIEFGAVNLTPSDPIQQDTYGLIAGLIVEPKGHVFCPDANTNAQGNVVEGEDCTSGKFKYRELVLVAQDNVGMLEDSQGNNVQVALNYRSEPLIPRFPPMPSPNPNNLSLAKWDLSPSLSNDLIECKVSLVGPVPLTCTPQCGGSTGFNCDPQTPVFMAMAGQPVRLHLLHPGGSSDQQVMVVHGHIWQDEPFTHGSTRLGWNPDSPWIGSRDIFGANSSYTLLLPSAGGANRAPGDYLIRTHPGNFFSQGMWNILRVTPRFTSADDAAAAGASQLAPATDTAPATETAPRKRLTKGESR